MGGKLSDGGNLILANHVTKFDQFILAMYYDKYVIRFVSGENVFKKPFLKWFATQCMNIIIHLRGVSSQETIREMVRGLKRGDNVMIFPTGTMTFDGSSKKIDESIAKVAKMSSANLVLLRIEGGYFIQPRWGITKRKGKISLSEYTITKDELKAMSASEVLDKINEHLYTDAYKVQEKAPVKYKGKKLCKGLESCIYECPSCKKISGLKSTDTNLFCSCGFDASYDEYGYLHDREGNTYTIKQLCDAQRESLKKKLDQADSGTHLFGDDFELTELHRNGKRVALGKIRVDVFTDHIEYLLESNVSENNATKNIDVESNLTGDKAPGNYVNYDEVESVFVYIRNTLNINLKTKKHGYELQGDFSNNALKYRDLFEIYKIS